MSAGVRAEFVRAGFVVAVLGVLMATPLFGIESAATITEDLYISDTANGQVYVLRTRWKGTKAATATLRGLIKKKVKAPTDVAVAANVVVFIDRARDLLIANTNTLQIVGKVKVGKDTRSVAITPDGTIAVVAQGKKNVHIIDVAKQKVIKKVKVGKTPWRVRLDDLGMLGVVTNVGNNTISILDIAVLASRTGSAATSRAAGVTTIKKGICNLSGGVDVARFGARGTSAIWSCGASPLNARASARARNNARPDPPAQTFRISLPFFGPFDLQIPDLTSTTNAFYNPSCPGVGPAPPEEPEDDGPTVTVPDSETPPERIGRAVGETSFSHNFVTGTRTRLGKGRMVNHFALANGNLLTVFHPQGVLVGKSKVLEGPGNTAISAVGSTLNGIPEVCSR